jgi:hypothetical protein
MQPAAPPPITGSTAMQEPIPGALLHHESPAEYFRPLVESALQRQHVDVHELTSFYVVNLLCAFVHADRAGAVDQPLGVTLVRALQVSGAAQRDDLRRVGDTSLFISGFFSDSLKAGFVDLEYYVHLGARAYGSLALRPHDAFADVFDELAAKFSPLVDVLNEVSEQSALSSNTDVLRLYEKWLRTGSRRSGSLLAARGILPIPTANWGTRVQ